MKNTNITTTIKIEVIIVGPSPELWKDCVGELEELFVSQIGFIGLKGLKGLIGLVGSSKSIKLYLYCFAAQNARRTDNIIVKAINIITTNNLTVNINYCPWTRIVKKESISTMAAKTRISPIEFFLNYEPIPVYDAQNVSGRKLHLAKRTIKHRRNRENEGKVLG